MTGTYLSTEIRELKADELDLVAAGAVAVDIGPIHMSVGDDGVFSFGISA